jgi:hypothetical protein
MNSKNSGYVGIVALLITVAIIALLSVVLMKRSYGPVAVPDGAGGTSTTTMHSAIESAETAKRMLESQTIPQPL